MWSICDRRTRRLDYEQLVLADDWSRELLPAIEAEDPVLQAFKGDG